MDMMGKEMRLFYKSHLTERRKILMEGNIVEYSVQLKKERTIFEKSEVINSSEDIVRIMKKCYEFADREKVYVILVDARKKVIGINLVSIGTIDNVIIHPREIFKPAIILGASAIIMVHNHPSGDVTPSKEDYEITDRIIECGNLLEVPLIDHIIFSEDDYYSIYDEME